LKTDNNLEKYSIALMFEYSTTDDNDRGQLSLRHQVSPENTKRHIYTELM
jgi:hypothetical protein